jgi:hypothetical protein
MNLKLITRTRTRIAFRDPRMIRSAVRFANHAVEPVLQRGETSAHAVILVPKARVLCGKTGGGAAIESDAPSGTTW